MDQKQKKIASLRGLVEQARAKINQLKGQLSEKDKQIEQVKIEYEKKIKTLRQDEGQIMKQYEERLIRIQKSLQESDNLVSKYQRLSQQTSKNYEGIMTQITNISNLITKNFAPSISKQSNEAVQQLCSIQKCKDFQQRMQRMQAQLPQVSHFIKSIAKLSYFFQESLKKKRESRLLYLKKQTAFQKQFQQQEQKYSTGNKEIQRLNQQIKSIQQKYEKKIQIIAKSKAKASQQKTNIQFIKQLFIKVIIGPKQASLMAFQVLSKVLKFTEDEYKSSLKKIK